MVGNPLHLSFSLSSPPPLGGHHERKTRICIQLSEWQCRRRSHLATCLYSLSFPDIRKRLYWIFIYLYTYVWDERVWGRRSLEEEKIAQVAGGGKIEILLVAMRRDQTNGEIYKLPRAMSNGGGTDGRTLFHLSLPLSFCSLIFLGYQDSLTSTPFVPCQSKSI